jgi:nucleoside-triphosphatase THEP1
VNTLIQTGLSRCQYRMEEYEVFAQKQRAETIIPALTNAYENQTTIIFYSIGKPLHPQREH